MIKGILKTSTSSTSDAPSTPTTRTQAGVTLGGAVTESPNTRRRGVLKKQLSFETDEPTFAPRLGPPPPPSPAPPPPPPSETPRPRPPPQQADLSAPVVADVDGQTAVRTDKIKNKAVARRLMLRDRRSLDDDTVTSFPGDDGTSGDVR